MPSSNRFRSSLLALLVLLAVLAPTPVTAAERAPTLVRNPHEVAGRYIVVLRGDAAVTVRTAADGLARGYGGRVTRVFTHAIDGYVAEMSEGEALELSRDPSVAYVEEDKRVSAVGVQSPATWGLDRIDQTSLPLNGSYSYGPEGNGVTAYVIDSGVRVSHQDFGGRASSGIDTIDGGSANDCNGHGTHVAGTIGGSTYGVAPSVSVVAVRVLDCNGSGWDSDVIAGVDWITADHSAGELAVANMSLGGAASNALDQAVVTSIADGVVYAIAAGNGDVFGNAINACTESPGRVAAALTVSATASNDARVSWANTGTCVDLFAPGYLITSAWKRSDTATKTISGTSMAAPHVAGVAALYLEANPASTPSQVAAAIVGGATQGVVGSPGTGSPNRLLYSGVAGTTTPPPPGSITLSVTGRIGANGPVAKLVWSGASGSNASVERNGAIVKTTANDGRASDKLGNLTGTFTYRVCQAGTSTCSNAASVTF